MLPYPIQKFILIVNRPFCQNSNRRDDRVFKYASIVPPFGEFWRKQNASYRRHLTLVVSDKFFRVLRGSKEVYAIHTREAVYTQGKHLRIQDISMHLSCELMYLLPSSLCFHYSFSLLSLFVPFQLSIQLFSHCTKFTDLFDRLLSFWRKCSFEVRKFVFTVTQRKMLRDYNSVTNLSAIMNISRTPIHPDTGHRGIEQTRQAEDVNTFFFFFRQPFLSTKFSSFFTSRLRVFYLQLPKRETPVKDRLLSKVYRFLRYRDTTKKQDSELVRLFRVCECLLEGKRVPRT